MSAVRIQAARRASGPPEIRHFKPKSDATFTAGALVARGTSADAELIVEHAGGATVTGIIGIAMVGVESGVPEAKGGTAYGTEVPIYIPNSDQIFSGLMQDASGIEIPTENNVGRSYGLVKLAADKIWYVDETDTSNNHVTVVDFDLGTNLVFFKFLASAVSI